MKTVIFVMILVTQFGGRPPYEEPMESLEACQAKVDEVNKAFMGVDEDFSFVAACRVQSTKSNPA